MAVNFSLGNFYGIDSLVEFLIIAVSLIIFYYSRKIYKLVKDSCYKYLSFAFLFIAISFIFKILSNLTIFYKVKIITANFVFTFFRQLEYMQLINFLSFILFKCFHIIGFLILFLIATKTIKKEKIFMFIYLSILVVILSVFFNFIFHLTIVAILLVLVLHFYQNYKKVKSQNSYLVFIAFLIIFISHLLFIFSDFNSLFYFLAEILLLIGFLCLLVNQIKLNKSHRLVNKNENKKNAFRSNKRFVKSIK